MFVKLYCSPSAARRWAVGPLPQPHSSPGATLPDGGRKGDGSAEPLGLRCVLPVRTPLLPQFKCPTPKVGPASATPNALWAHPRLAKKLVFPKRELNFMALTLSFPHTIGAFLPSLPLDSLLSTQGIMVMLLAAYAVAMWMFLTSAPKVYTVMVSDLEIAKQFYEGMLGLPAAEVPLHYYYNYEQTLGATAIDPLYMSSVGTTPATPGLNAADGLWYQLQKNTQLHVISGASLGNRNRQRHVGFDRECMDKLLQRVQALGIKYKIRREKPLNFLVKDFEGRVIEMAELSN